MLGHYTNLEAANLGLPTTNLVQRTTGVTPFSYSYQRQDRNNILLNDYGAGRQPLGMLTRTEGSDLRQQQRVNIKTYGSVQFLNERNIDNDRSKPSDFGAGVAQESQEARRKTVGGSALEGLINQFRNNSLGDDLRKLKEAHKEIIEDLKTAFFQKKPKKRGISKEKAKVSQNPRKLGIERRQTLNGQVRRHSPSPPRKPFLSDMDPQTRVALPKNQKPTENHRRPVPQTFKNTNNSAVYAQKEKDIYRYNTVNVAEQAKNSSTNEVGDARADKGRSIKFQVPVSDSERQKRVTYQLNTREHDDKVFEGLDNVVVEEILGLREVKISLMKQLNQETSNFNRVILENKKIQSQNTKLREQLNSKQNVQNIPYSEQLSKENQKMKERISKLENELQKTNKELKSKDKFGTDNIRLEHNLSAAEREIERLNSVIKTPKLGLNDSKSQSQRLKEQLAEVQAHNQKMQQELESYRSLYGRVDSGRAAQAHSHQTHVTYNPEQKYQYGNQRQAKW